MAKSNGSPKELPETPPAITSLSISGFKSIVDEQTLAIRPLTLLAGANSSGKSSMMQPLLLLKQTLEAPYDPGPLLLNGPSVRFTSARQFLPVRFGGSAPATFVVKVGTSRETEFAVGFVWKGPIKKLSLEFNEYKTDKSNIRIDSKTTIKDFLVFARSLSEFKFTLFYTTGGSGYKPPDYFFKPESEVEGIPISVYSDKFLFNVINSFDIMSGPGFGFSKLRNDLAPPILNVIHLPGLRGNPARTYSVADAGPAFSGTFESYVASLVARWSTESSQEIKELSNDLNSLGLTWKIEAKPIDDTQVELRVGRMPRPKQGGAHDMVSIADVGFGVSQTLPVVVALQVANPGQLVYIEQPEIHLHPRAQVAMARLLVNAANRGVRVVAETHSSLLLLAIQTLIAEGRIDPGLVGLNWFLRSDKDGTTQIKTAELDEAGRFGDWPEDFDEVALEAENRYLSAAEARLAKE
jgi:AAA domain, putative AbiEii toxin, Type IV TA system